MADDYTNFITLFTEFPFCLTDHTGDAYSFSQVFCILPTLLVLLAGLVVKVGQILNVKNRIYYFLFGMTLTAAYPFLRMLSLIHICSGKVPQALSWPAPGRTVRS